MSCHKTNVEVDARNCELICSLDEYETQFFGFTPKSFCNGIYNAVNEYILDSLKVLEELFTQQFPDVSSQIKDSINNIKPFLAKQIDLSFDKLEIYLVTNIFCIPNYVVLPEDSIQEDQHCSKEDSQLVEQSILDIRDRILAVKYANLVLQQELHQSKKNQATLVKINDEFRQLHEELLAANVTNLQDFITHSSAQVDRSLQIFNAASSILRSLKPEDSQPEVKHFKSS